MMKDVNPINQYEKFMLINSSVNTSYEDIDGEFDA